MTVLTGTRLRVKWIRCPILHNDCQKKKRMSWELTAANKLKRQQSTHTSPVSYLTRKKRSSAGKKNQKDTSRSANRWLHKRATEECMHARSSDEAFRGDCTRARVALQPPKVRQVESHEYLIISRHVPRTAKRT